MDARTIDERYKRDVENSLIYWTNTLQDRFDDIEYLYAKGSAVKPWETIIDYVPMVSDVDLHIKFEHPKDFTEALGKDALSESLDIADKYERSFPQQYDTLHTPRMQVIPLDESKLAGFIPPLTKQIRLLIGSYEPPVMSDIQTLRELDRENLRADSEYILKLPGRIIDRVDIEFWTLIRSLCWRVSPSPVRLLNQVLPQPLETWTWNRTTIVDELENQGYKDIATSYTEYYLEGWRLFDSGMRSSVSMRKMIKHAVDCIQMCTEQLSST